MHILFPKYIHTPNGDNHIILHKKFKNIIETQNMVKHIDGCHIPLYENLIKGKTCTLNYFINKKVSTLYYLQIVCGFDKLF
jgi:hypothetical protein